MIGERLLTALRELNRLLGLVMVVGEVAHAGQDVGAERSVLAQPGESEGPIEMLLCDCVPTGVMRHPAGHVGQSRGSREEGLVSSTVAAAEETGTNLAVQIGVNSAIQVATSDLLVGDAKCVYGATVSVSPNSRPEARHPSPPLMRKGR
jgi:hypothetical protein